MVETKDAPFPAPESESNPGLTLVENLPSPERPKLRLLKSIALTGPESAGKGKVIRILQERHNWKVFDGSEIGFERKGNKAESGHIERTAKQHKAMDRRQARIFRKLIPGGEQIAAEAKLSGIILAEQKDIREDQIEKIERQNRPRIQDGRKPIEAPKPIPAVTINLWATKEVRIKRAYDDAINKYVAHLEKYLEQSELIMNGIQIPKDELIPPPPDNPPTKDLIEKLMEERQKRDVADWAPLHPNYVRIGENPYSRTLERPKNRGLVYDRWIDTSKMTPEEVADKFEEFAIELGAAVPLTLKEHEAIARGVNIDELPSSGEIFDSEKVVVKDAEKIETNGSRQSMGSFKRRKSRSLGKLEVSMKNKPGHPSNKNDGSAA